MKQLLVLLGFIAVTSAAWTGGLRAKFDANLLAYGRSNFFNVPRTVGEAVAAGYTRRTRLAGLPLPTLTLYCPTPAALCTLYDDTNYIAGLQVGVNVAQFKPHLNQEAMGLNKWKTTDGEYYIANEYFVSDSFLRTPAATRIALRNAKTMLQDKSIWLQAPGGKLLEVPRDEKDIGKTDFLIEACIPLMGRHYYYKMAPGLECTAENILPWFPMYDAGELVGVGYMNFGPLTVDKTRDWFERPSASAVKMIVPSAPQCLYDMAEKPGALTMHTYFVENPRLIACLPFGK